MKFAMMGRVLDFFSTAVAMDLGTTNTLIYLRRRGIVLQEPTMIAVDEKSGNVVAVGKLAKNLLGRHSRRIQILRPLKEGAIQEFEATSLMLRLFLGQVLNGFRLARPKLVIAVPTGITSVEEWAVIEAAQMAGAGKVYLIEEPLAAAIGAKLPVHQTEGQMVINIGGGTTEVALISRLSIVCSKSVRTAGDEINAAIMRHIQHEHQMTVSETLAENLKIKIGSAVPLEKRVSVQLRGKDIITGMPKTVTVTDEEIRDAVKEPLLKIVEAAKLALEKAPPDLTADVARNGLWLAGGGALLTGLKELFHRTTGLEVNLCEDPLRCVALGAGAVLERFRDYRGIFLHRLPLVGESRTPKKFKLNP